MARSCPELTEEVERVSQPVEDERELIVGLQQRRETALQTLMDIHGSSIQHLVAKLMAFDSEVEDVVQNVFLKAWRNAPSFRGDSSLRTWLFRIAIHETRVHQRAVYRWWRKLEKLWSERSTDQFASSHSAVADPRWESIQRAMALLAPSDRELLVLVYIEGCSISEVLELSNENRNAVEVRLHRARNRLKQIIATQSSES